MKTPERAEYWSAEFAELSRKNAVKKEEDRKEAWKVQSRLLALVNKSPSCPREEEVVILDADEGGLGLGGEGDEKSKSALPGSQQLLEVVAPAEEFKDGKKPVTEAAVAEAAEGEAL